MVMGPQQNSTGSDGAFLSASIAVASLKKEAARLASVTDALHPTLPALSDIVVATHGELRKKMLGSLREFEAQVTREQDVVDALGHRLSKRELAPLRSRALSLKHFRSEIVDKISRAEDLFYRGSAMPPEVDTLSHKQTIELLGNLATFRAAFWRRLYEIPFIQSEVIATLEAARQPERTPSLALHTAAIDKPDEQNLRDKITDVLSQVAKISRARRGPLSRTAREAIAEKLSEVPLAAHDLNEQFSVLQAKLSQLIDSEIALVSRYGKTTAPGAKEDPAYQMWDSLSRELGGGALRARECITEVARLQEPYLRIRNYVATANNFFVQKVVKDRGRYLPYRDDVIQEGTFGLMRAIEKFDVASGRHFLTYASYWIAQTAARGWERISQQIPVPGRLHMTLAKLRQEVGDCKRVDHATLAKKLGEKKEHITSLVPFIGPVGSLNSLVPGTTLSPDRLIEDPFVPNVVEKLDGEVHREVVRKALGILKEKEAAVIIGRFGLDGEPPQTLEEIARKLGVTKERIRQIQNMALKSLKAGTTGTTLKKLADELEL